MESFLPNYPGSPNANLSGNVNTAVQTNNYLGTQINGRDSHLYDWRVDYDFSRKTAYLLLARWGSLCISTTSVLHIFRCRMLWAIMPPSSPNNTTSRSAHVQ